MSVNFWGEMSEEYLKNNPQAPPLTDETRAIFERQTGLKLPNDLVNLLRIKNGGILQNTDFTFRGKKYEVSNIRAVTQNDAFDSTRSYDCILNDSDWSETRRQLQKIIGDLSKLLCVAEPNGHPYAFALNYNHLNATGEPTVYYISLGCDEAAARQIGDSFADLLAGQYFGDEHPTVNLAEAQKYQVIAEGAYEGRYKGHHEKDSTMLSGLPVRVSWKICSDGDRLIVFQESDWAGQLEITRGEIHKSTLAFDFPSLESFGIEIETELAELIRPAIEIEILSKFDAPLMPDCYELLLHIQPGSDKWVRIDSSSPYQNRWKNDQVDVVYSSLKSSSKVQLRRTLQAVISSCSGEQG